MSGSNPGFVTGQIPTAAQWNSYFTGKTDSPLLIPTGSAGAQRTIPYLLSELASGGALTQTQLQDIVATFAQALYLAQPTIQYWVSTTGSDSNSGTFASPFLTAAHAVGVATTSGTFVYFRGGTYSLAAKVSLSASNNGVTFMSWPGETAIFDGGSTTDPLWESNNWIGGTIQGIQFQNTANGSGFYYGCLHMYQSYQCNITANYFFNCFMGVNLDNSSWNTISGNIFQNFARATGNTNPAAGINGGGGTNNNLVIYNYFNTSVSLNGGTGTNTSGVSFRNGAGNKIISNNFAATIGCAILVATTAASNGSIYGTVIQYNYCTNCCTSTAAGADCGVIYIDNQGQQLNNNVLIDANYVETLATSTSLEIAGIYLDDYSSGCTVTNNVIGAFTTFGILLHAGQNNLFENNIINMGSITSSNCAAGLFQTESGFTLGSMTNNIVTKNIIYSTAGTAPGTVWQGISTAVGNVTVTGNYYYNTSAASMANVSGTGVADASPTTANPGFVNPVSSSGTPPICYDMGSSAVVLGGFLPPNEGLWGVRQNIPHWPSGWPATPI